jgi:uncharacterized alkaline shock family protein YloU
LADKKKPKKTRREKSSRASSGQRRPPGQAGKPWPEEPPAADEAAEARAAAEPTEAREAAGAAGTKSGKAKSGKATAAGAAGTSPVGGEVEFDPGIISDIAIREASEIEGIAELTGGWRTKGVTVGQSPGDGEPGGEGNAGYIVDLRIAVEYGVNCVALTETIRKRIADAIHRMTGRRTVAINVHVTGIRERGLREEPHEEVGPLGEEHGIDF